MKDLVTVFALTESGLAARFLTPLDVEDGRMRGFCPVCGARPDQACRRRGYPAVDAPPHASRGSVPVPTG